MHHKAIVKLGTANNLPFNIQCECGTGGDFGSYSEAVNWMSLNHFRFLGGVNTAEIVDTTPKPATTEKETEEVKEGENLGSA